MFKFNLNKIFKIAKLIQSLRKHSPQKYLANLRKQTEDVFQTFYFVFCPPNTNIKRQNQCLQVIFWVPLYKSLNVTIYIQYIV